MHRLISTFPKFSLGKFQICRPHIKYFSIPDPMSEDEHHIDIDENYTPDAQLPYISTLKGRFSFFPIDDHPLLPGYVRMIPISKKLENKLADPTTTQKVVVSTLKNPEMQQGMKAALYLNNQISQLDEQLRSRG